MIRRTATTIRVAVQVAGDYRQKYFSIAGESRKERARILRQARALERRWLNDQRRAADNRRHRAKPTARARWPHRTGVRGITLQFATRGRGERAWRGPRFEVTGAGVTTCVGITSRGLTPAWRQAVRILAGAQGLRDYSHWLRRRPALKQLRALKRLRR